MTVELYRYYHADTSSQAAATSNTIPDIPSDPLHPGEIRLHSWHLFTP